MHQKFELGEDVEIQLIGRITEIMLRDGKPVYTIEGKSSYARGINENQILPLFVVGEKNKNNP